MSSKHDARLQMLLTRAKIEKESFADMTLTSLRPAGRWFDGCEFAGADLRFATLDSCFFRFCDFSGANLQSASMRGATFAGCNFTDADLSNCDLTGSTLTAANTGAANGVTIVTGAVLTGARLGGIVTERVVGWADH